MAATKNTKSKVNSPEALAKRNATREANANLVIDFGAGMAPAEMTAKKAASRSMWPVRILQLLEGIESGAGEVDTYYQIGTFGTATGASAVVQSFKQDPDRLPCQVILEPRKVGTGENVTSELWALIPSDEYLAGLEGGEVEYEDEAE